MNVGKSKVMKLGMEMGFECTCWREWIVFSTCGRKWQLMEDVKGMWYTE